MSYECNFLFEFLPCVLLILCFVSMIFLTHAGMISQHAPWQNSYALTIRCFHVASHINRGVTRIFSKCPYPPAPCSMFQKVRLLSKRSYCIQLFRERLSEEMRTRQSRKVIWDMINTLFVTTEAVELLLLLSFSTRKHMSVASRTILSNFFEEHCPQSHPQYLSGLSRALPTTVLEIAVWNDVTV